MRRSIAQLLFFLFIFVGFSGSRTVHAQSESAQPVVRAVLFYSPTCPHCHVVRDDVLPPLQEQYGDQLVILEVDASQPSGQRVYQNYLTMFNVPDNRVGVPALIIEDVVMVGSQEIPDRFPSLIAAGLAQGGTEWPAIPGLDTESVSTGEQSTAAKSSGMTLAWFVLIGMFAALLLTIWLTFRIDWQSLPATYLLPIWLIPLISLGGIAVSGYMTYVEVSQVAAVCGPIGDCNAVQGSEYAQILGVPVALLGLVFYLVIALVWMLLPRMTDINQRRLLTVALLGLSILGVLFSIYLTALEIFTIQAICAWCLTSAILTTSLMLLISYTLADSSRTVRRSARRQRRHLAR